EANIAPVGPSVSNLALSGGNPTRMSSSLVFSLATAGHARLAVYDAQGRLVRTLVDQDAAAGSFRAHWDGRSDSGASAGRGVFFAHFTVDGKDVDTRKIVLE